MMKGRRKREGDREYEEEKRKRSYRKEWEQEFKWLAYDEEKCVMFCRTCREQNISGRHGKIKTFSL